MADMTLPVCANAEECNILDVNISTPNYTVVDGWFDTYIPIPSEHTRLSDGTWECRNEYLSPILQRNLTIWNSLVKVWDRYPLNPYMERDAEIHVLNIAVASQLPVGLDIFRKFTFELRGFVHDQLDDVAFTPMIADIIYQGSTIEHAISLDCIDMGPLKEMAGSEPMYKQKYEMVADEVIPHFRNIGDFLARMKYNPAFGLMRNIPNLPKHAINKNRIYILHAECTGWPLGQFNRVPTIYMSTGTDIDGNQVTLESVGSKSSLCPTLVISNAELISLFQRKTNCLYCLRPTV